MEGIISEDLLERLTAVGYTTRDTLPNVREKTQWADVAVDCNFSNPQLNRLINALFPVQGKSYSFLARFLLYSCRS